MRLDLRHIIMEVFIFCGGVSKSTVIKKSRDGELIKEGKNA